MFGVQKFNASTNAVLVCHTLRHMELVPANPLCAGLRDCIIGYLRESLGAAVPEETLEGWFNSWPKFRKLLVVAEAFARLSIAPLLPPEVWCRVKNPFDSTLESERHRRAAEQRLAHSYGVSVDVDECWPFLSAIGLFDEALPVEPQPEPIRGAVLWSLNTHIGDAEKSLFVFTSSEGFANGCELVTTDVQACVLIYLGQAPRFAGYGDFQRTMTQGDHLFIAPSFVPGTRLSPSVRYWAIYLAWMAFRGGMNGAKAQAFVEPHLDRWRNG